MATRQSAVVETRTPATTREVQPSPQILLEQYECGPVAFSGSPGAMYERHLVFDHVVAPQATSLREHFEAVARSVRDLLVPRWLQTDVTDAQANPK